MSIEPPSSMRPARAASRPHQEHHHQGLRARRDRRLARGAGAGRFLGAVVRPLPAAHPRPGKGGARGEGRGQAGQAQYRRASADPGADGRAVDPRGVCLQRRPARRRLHGRAARSARQGLHRAADRRHGGRHRRRSRGRRGGARFGRPQRRGANSSARCCKRTPRTRKPRRGSPSATSRPAISPAPSRPWRSCRPPRRRARRWRARAPRSSLRARRARPATSRALSAKVAADPTDHQARFDLALALNAKGERNGALDELLTIVRKERGWNDEAARKQLVQLFDAWGPTDPATLAGRQKLSSLLFA